MRAIGHLTGVGAVGEDAGLLPALDWGAGTGRTAAASPVIHGRLRLAAAVARVDLRASVDAGR